MRRHSQRLCMASPASTDSVGGHRGTQLGDTVVGMGYRTAFIGSLEIDPALNDDEFSYLVAFAESRRCTREQGPYWVPDNPLVYDRGEERSNIDDYNTPAKGQPQLWCPWIPGGAEHLMISRGDGKHYEPGAWLQYLLDHFLSPTGRAKADRSGLFDKFTFDHDVVGVVGACRDDTGELWLIRPEGGVVREEVLWPGQPGGW
jgi:hypothetical protein